MKKRYIVSALVIGAIVIQVASQDKPTYLEGGSGKVRWTHDGKDINDDVEDWIKYNLFYRNNQTRVITTIRSAVAWPDTIDQPILLPVVRGYNYSIGVVAYDESGNMSDTCWTVNSYTTYPPDTTKPSKPCGLTCYK